MKEPAIRNTRIRELAALVSTSTAKIDDFLESRGLPSLSFDIDVLGDLGTSREATDVEDARKTALEASIELQDLLQGPTSLLRPVFNGTSLQAIYKYRIAFKVPLDGRISFTELAELCKLPELDLRRILRFAMVWHRCFHEPEEGFVAHTAASRQLAEDPRAHDMAGLMFEECWQSMARTVEAIQTFDGHEPNETGHALAHNTRDNTFEWLSKHPAQAKRFASAISTLVPSGRPASFLIEIFDWASLGDGTVVDVGGSSGGVSVLILRKLVPALKTGAKIVINDSLVPTPGTLSLLAERNVRAYDMLMMTLFNAREREKKDWVQLLRDADPRYKLVNARKPGYGTMGVVEVDWAAKEI